MQKNDGTLNLGGEQTPLMKLLLQRRSCRKYDDQPAPSEAVEYLLGCTRRLQERCRFTAPRISALPRGPAFDQVVRAATGGMIGMVNPWLTSMKASHLLICGVVYPEDPGQLGLAIEQAALTMQVAVLAATEMGCATCWIAGINHDRVEDTLQLGDGVRLIALSPLGRPPRRMGLSWDSMVHHLTSKRRRPLEDLWMEEVWR